MHTSLISVTGCVSTLTPVRFCHCTSMIYLFTPPGHDQTGLPGSVGVQFEPCMIKSITYICCHNTAYAESCSPHKQHTAYAAATKGV
jgi:hypothetical protein